MKNKKLSDLLFQKRRFEHLSNIKDLDKLEEIFLNYINRDYIKMCNGITEYGEIEFLTDFFLFLNNHKFSSGFKKDTPRHIYQLYNEEFNIRP